MSQKRKSTEGYIRRSRSRAVLGVALCAGVLAGCSSVPDAVNPVEWYRGARDWVTGAEEPAESKTAPKPSTADGKDFPQLSTVPPRPQPPTAAERKQLANSLAADRADARYSDEMIRRQTDSTGKMTESPPPPPTRSASKVASAPATAPTPVPAPPPASTPPPAPAPYAAAPPAVPPMPAAGTAASAPPPMAPMPAAPPAPGRMSAAVPPMPAAPPAMAPPGPPPIAPPPMAPPTAASAMGPGGAVFGPVPPDIDLARNGGMRQAMPRPAGGQRSMAARPFSPGMASRAGAVPQPYAPTKERKLGTVRFGVGSAKLSGTARAAIGRMAKTIKRSHLRVRVVGHASSWTRNMSEMRHYMANFQVSLDRANAVARELRRRGVAAAAITVEAVSDTDPAFFEVMPAGEAGNRRVEILIEN